MSRLAALRLPALPELPDAPRRAAVAAIFGPGEELLLIRRAERPGDHWSGHMAFPGGREDPGDPSLLDTARRETWEELGLDLAEAELLGALPAQSTPTIGELPRLVVVPFVFRLPGWGALSPNQEVRSVHPIGLERFLAAEGRGDFPYSWQGTTWRLPCVDLDGQRIWGMTLRMIDDLCDRLR